MKAPDAMFHQDLELELIQEQAASSFKALNLKTTFRPKIVPLFGLLNYRSKQNGNAIQGISTPL